jgi:DNA polymerase I-like protein with 3'-5' exonuclease and polymerase domains
MVDSETDYNKFLQENCNDDLFLHLLFEDDKLHSINSTPCVLFVFNLNTEELFYINFTHQDSPFSKPVQDVFSDLDSFIGRFFVLDKKSWIQHSIIKDVLDINLGVHLSKGEIITIDDFETAAHRFLKFTFASYSSINKSIPLLKHKEMVSDICVKIKKIYDTDIFKEKFFHKINSDIIEPLSELESNGIFVDKKSFKNFFELEPSTNGLVYSQYNILTSTGRPSNRFDGVNYAALNKEDGSRGCFVSRFGEDGMMVLIDYSSFHPRIICELIDFKLPLDVDFYPYLAKLCFKKSEVDQKDIDDIKTLTFRQIYGGIEDKYSHIQYFYNLNKFINSNWDQFKQYGYSKTPFFERKIMTHHITDPNPNKLFNYILQATETEISVPIIGKINTFLKDFKSKAILYTYDSLLFDVHKSEFNTIKTDVVDIMKTGRFPVKVYVGRSYNSLGQITL